jgi:hypothetical protein
MNIALKQKPDAARGPSVRNDQLKYLVKPPTHFVPPGFPNFTYRQHARTKDEVRNESSQTIFAIV